MAKRKDAKTQMLAEHASLNPHPEKVGDALFATHEFLDARDLVQVKYEMLHRVRVDGQSVRQVSDAFGFSRPVFYQAQEAFGHEGLPGLIPKRRGPKGAHKLTEAVMRFAEKRLAEDPTLSGAALAELIRRRFHLPVHPRSVERALRRRQKKG